MFNLSIMIINMATGWNLPDLHDMFTYAYNLTRDGFSHCPSYMQEIAWVWLLLDFACDLEGNLVRNAYYGPNAFDWDTMQWDMSRGKVWQYHFGDD